MVANHTSVLVPFWNGRYYADKPPLYFWLSSIPTRLFGSGEWQSRIMGVAAASLATLLLYLIAKQLTQSPVPLLSVTIFITLGQVVPRLAMGNLDALLICLQLLSLYLFLISKERRTLLLLSGIAAGLAALTKGWLLGIYPLSIIFLYHLIYRKFYLRSLTPLVAGFAASFLWWHLAGLIRFGSPFLSWYLLHPAGGNLSSVRYLDFRTFSKYLFHDLGAWILLIPCALFSHKGKKIASNANLFLLLSSLAFFLPLNFLKEKFDWYIIPLYPYLAILLSYLAYKAISRFGKIGLVLLFVLFSLQVIHLIYQEAVDPDRSLIGADLGKTAKMLISPEEKIFLDDQDFPSFIYYSDHKSIYVLSSVGGKLNEWWIIKPSQIPLLTTGQNSYWIITTHPSNFNHLGRIEETLGPHQYYFLHFSSSQQNPV